MALCLLQQLNRTPPGGAEPPVDAIGLDLHVHQQILVALDPRAAWRADLHEGEAAAIVGILLEEPLDAEEALEDALRVVDPIDARADELRRYERDPAGGRPIAGLVGRRLEGDADRMRTHDCRVIATPHREPVPLDA